MEIILEIIGDGRGLPKKEIDLSTALQEALDPVELAEIRANFTGIQRLLEGKDKRIEEFAQEVETFNVFAHHFKNVGRTLIIR